MIAGRDGELAKAIQARFNGGEKANQTITRRLDDFPPLRNLDAVIVTLSDVATVTNLTDELHKITAAESERRFVGLWPLDSTHILLLFSQ